MVYQVFERRGEIPFFVYFQMPSIYLWPSFSGLQATRGGGGRGTPLYKPYMFVSPQRVGFLSRFGLKTGISPLFARIGGYGFRGNFGSVWTYLSFQFQMYANSKCILEIFIFSVLAL